MVDCENKVIPPATTAESGAIKAIAKDTVHKICSGQVVLSLAVAVKELVENAIDAGATLIEVKLRDQGLELVEVCDNGTGVEEHNLEGMTAKYHTSKIREFVDLQCVETFGFRGEALSSLCALSDMIVQTRHKSSDVGIKIELDHKGKIKARTPCARSIGTTVSLSNLFATLPVRRRDFTRNIKKEFTKMCQILQAYCLVSKGVRIICNNQTPKGSKSVVLQTHGSQDILGNISSIFSSRQVTEIVAIKSPFEQGQLNKEALSAELQSDAGEISNEDIERLNAAEFQLDGYISNCSHGAGRSSKDRQFFFVNSRPCEPKNIAKVVNEIYHRYNGHQYPFVYLNIFTSRADVDVNLTPDKRILMLNHEKILLLALKKALLNTFGNTPSIIKLQNTTIVSVLENKHKTNAILNSVSANETIEDNDNNDVPITSSQRFLDVLSQWKHTGDTKGIAPRVKLKRKCDHSDEIRIRSLKLQKVQEFLTKEEPIQQYLSYKSDEDSNDEASKEVVSCTSNSLNISDLKQESHEYDTIIKTDSKEGKFEHIDCKIFTPVETKLTLMENKPVMESQSQTPTVNNESITINTEMYTDVSKHIEKCLIELDTARSDGESISYSCGELCTSLAEIAHKMQVEEQLQKDKLKRNKLERLRFKSKINPNQNETAEAELQKEISKEDFARMEIIGQFNLGFIIVKLDDDLFIIDQHATDEKYNFEILQRTTTLDYQRLAIPQTLELTTVNEMILLDHLNIFEKNGFKFEINENAATTKKIRLLGKPYSKNWQFGKEDIDELIFMLQDAPGGNIYRPSRVRAMFASRACRKSVMIGKSLNQATMRTLVTHMGEIEQPWNCPHGRPTMRHVVNIAMLMDDIDNR